MTMQTVRIPLSDNHGVALQHSSAVSPEEVIVKAKTLGRVTSHSTYILQDSTFMTFLFFSEAEEGDSCFAAFQSLHKSHPLRFIGVGWVHENSESAFARKPYVTRKWLDSSTELAESSVGNDENAFSVVYTGRLSPETVAKVRAATIQYALELFEDDKEGGRLFCRFSTVDVEDKFRQQLKETVGSLGRELSFADAVDFALAKRDSHRGKQ